MSRHISTQWGYGFIQNENAKRVSGIECLPLHGYAIFGKESIFFEPQSTYW